jgi:hypothetical protein
LHINPASIKLKFMAANFQTYVGIDVQAMQKPYFYTALNADLENIACGHGRLADVLAYLSGQSSAIVAINGPVCVQPSDRESLQDGLFDKTDNSGNHISLRTGDAELDSKGFPIAAIGKKIPLWVERSLELADGIKQMGYRIVGSGETVRAFFETQCDAAYWLSAGAMPYDSRSLEGRLQRQLLLCEFGFHLTDPMIFLEEFTRYRLRTSQIPVEQVLMAHELRAMIAAASAWLLDVRPETMEHFGTIDEGEILLPREFLRK